MFPAHTDESRPLDPGMGQRYFYAARDAAGITKEIGRASCRERVLASV